MFQKLKEGTREEQPGMGRHAVPVIGVQKSDGIGKCKTESGGSHGIGFRHKLPYGDIVASRSLLVASCLSLLSALSIALVIAAILKKVSRPSVSCIEVNGVPGKTFSHGPGHTDIPALQQKMHMLLISTCA